MKKFVSENRRLLAAAVGSTALVAGSANAALPTEATAAISQITGNVSDMEAAVWPVIGAVVAAMILIKLFKRFANKI